MDGSTNTGYTRAGEFSQPASGVNVNSQSPSADCDNVVGTSTIDGSETPATPEESSITGVGVRN